MYSCCSLAQHKPNTQPAAWYLAAAARSTSCSPFGHTYEREAHATWIWAGTAIYGDQMVLSRAADLRGAGPRAPARRV